MDGPVLTLNELVAGGIIGSILAGIFAGIHILLNKKVRAPSDNLSANQAAIAERNEIVTGFRTDLAAERARIAAMEIRQTAQDKHMEEQDDEIDLLKSESLQMQHYIYRCINTIYKLGTAEDIPQPPPTKIKIHPKAGD